MLALALLAPACSGGVAGKPGASGVRDPYFPKLGNGGYDVTHYAVTLDVDPDEQRLRGSVEITARATQDLSSFNLDLAGLTVDSATVEGRPAAVNRAGDELTLRTDAKVEDRLRRGETFRAVVRYSGSPKTITDPDESEEGWLPTDDGALALGEPTGSMAWFPGNHHPSDKAAYDLTVTVPKGLTAVSNGVLAGPPTTEKGRTTFRWHTAEPMASYLATLAVGRFDTKTSTMAGGITVFTAVDPEVAKASARTVARVPEVVAWEAEHFGPYPFSATGAIVEREQDAGYALETQNRPVFPGPPGMETLVHEMAHQWFGDSVTPESWRDMWLNEGPATYAEWLWAEEKEDTPADESFDDAYEDEDNWAFPPADPPSAADISEQPVYGRGAMVIHKIREAVDDDEEFFALLKGWTKAHRHGNASTADFTAYVEEETGQDLSGLWKAWLYGRSRPAADG
ncbi:M1 family peptidase [Streptomyces sp. A0958]|uniref:M1 family metallopeptidase n=1 Tax=Streptomyces sp. A0958 TaxID=2563101 RepID=UPI00109E7DAE|nr:M1 family metallopeptidase [Streptomyces sp. A0958]THA72961.1 M1 family peptidase [Streptomyces sp. A0958]